LYNNIINNKLIIIEYMCLKKMINQANHNILRYLRKQHKDWSEEKKQKRYGTSILRITKKN